MKQANNPALSKSVPMSELWVCWYDPGLPGQIGVIILAGTQVWYGNKRLNTRSSGCKRDHSTEEATTYNMNTLQLQ